MQQRDSYYMDLKDLKFDTTNVTKIEVKFIRYYLDKLSIDMVDEEDNMIVGTSNEVANLIVDVIREYESKVFLDLMDDED